MKFFLKLRLVYYFIQALHITLVSGIITEKENFLEYGVEDFQLEIYNLINFIGLSSTNSRLIRHLYINSQVLKSVRVCVF